MVSKTERTNLSGRVVKAMGMFGGTQALNILCGMVRVKLVSIWVGAAGIGFFSIFNSVLTLVSTFTQLNLRSSSVREIASADRQRRPQVAWLVRRWGWLLGLLGLVVMIGLSPVLSRVTFDTWGDWQLFVLLAPAVLLMALTSGEQSVMQGSGELGPLARSSVTGSLVGLLLTLPLVWAFRLDGIIPSLIAYAAAAYGACLIYRRRPERVPSLSLGESWRQGQQMLRIGLYMTIAAGLTELANYLVITYINTVSGEEAVGVYQSGFTIAGRYIGMVFTAIGVEYFPRLVSVKHSPRRQQTFVAHELLVLTLVITPLIVLLMPMVPLVVRLLYTDEFLPAVPFVVFAMPGMVMRAMAWCMAFVILARGDGPTYVVTEAISAASVLALSVWLYGLYGIAGLGIAFTADYLVYLVAVALVYRVKYGLMLRKSVLIAWLSALAIVIGATWAAIAGFALQLLPFAGALAAISITRLRRLNRRERKNIQ